ncbi:MAG: type III-A CRISPR-associated RAMP protein Csm3 [Candidatus Woesearchaeota archaeon]
MVLKRKIIIDGNIEVLTGLRIGGSEQEITIGGVDNPVIRTNGNPYIPGSSLKGKLRALLEMKYGVNEISIKLFGSPQSEEKKDSEINEPGRLIVRDSESIEGLKTEIKFENTIDRITSKTKKGGIRQVERVPAGNKFKFQIVFNDYGNDQELFEKLKESMELLEKDYLGGCGTRGYGRIKFTDLIQTTYPGEETKKVSNITELKY